MAMKEKAKRRRVAEEETASEATQALQAQLQDEQEKFMTALADYGGRRPTDDDILQEGTKLVIPQTMTPATAVEFLENYIGREEKEHQFDRLYRYRPWDGAAALQRALLKMFGTVGIGKRIEGFFFSQPPEMKTINIDVGKTTQVPWGAISVQMLEGTIFLNETHDPEYGDLFHLFVNCPRKYRHHVEGLFKLVEQELQTASIYRGKAIDGKHVPEFLDLATVDSRRVIYSDEVIQQLHANIWSLLDHGPIMREMEMPLKRAVLLEGPYGTGKTLAAFLTAQRAVWNGWSFIYCRPGRDDLDQVMGTARLYQPSVVFFEDVDIVAHGNSEDRDAVTRLLDVFDGITAKGTELLCVMTTNHPERIHKAMVRPGRLDAVIHIGALDTNGIQRMIESSVPEGILAPDIDYPDIGDAMEGYLPAYVKEAIDRTMRYAIAREGGRPTQLDTADFILAASGLRDQLKLQEEAKEGGVADPIAKTIEKAVRNVVGGTQGVVPGDDGHTLMVLKTD
jgi:transitional endoplasmic reticulum ATPase